MTPKFNDLAFGRANPKDTERFLLLGLKKVIDNEYAATAGIPEGPLTITTAVVATNVVITWVPVPGATRYQVYRGTTTAFEAASLIATVHEQGPVGVRSYSDVPDQPATTPLYYWVWALDETNEGPISNRETELNP